MRSEALYSKNSEKSGASVTITVLGTSFHQQLSSKGNNVFLRYLGTVYRDNVHRN
jgi:hypothetical protein